MPPTTTARASSAVLAETQSPVLQVDRSMLGHGREGRPEHFRQSHYAVAGLLLVILTVGFSLRIANLAGPDFNIDEVLHAFAAQQMLEGNRPTLPSGRLYPRALPYTRLVALVGRFRGIDEWTARLPSVLFGCLSIALVFVIGRKWYSSAAGLVAASITALAPMQIAFSREGRMYAALECFFLLFVFLFFQGLESPPRRIESRWLPESFQRRVGALGFSPLLLVCAAVAFAVGRRFHDLMLVAVLGPAAYVFGMAVVVALFSNRLQLRGAKYVVAALLMVAYGSVNHVWARYEWINAHTPAWAVNNTWRYYIQVLAASSPVILPSLGLATGLALARNTKATLFVLSCLGAPLLVQSFLLTWRHERYIVHLVPLLFILFAVGACAVVSYVHRSVAEWGRGVLGARAAKVAAAGFMAGAVAFFLAFMPWARDGIAVHRTVAGTVAGVYHHNWRAAVRFVSSRANPTGVVIASAPGLAYYYGLHSRLYYLANDSTEMHLEEGLRDSEGRLLEYIAGAPMILDLAMLQDVVATHASGWVVTERFRFEGSRPLPRDIRDFIETHCQKEEVPDAPSMVVWSWGVRPL